MFARQCAPFRIHPYRCPNPPLAQHTTKNETFTTSTTTCSLGSAFNRAHARHCHSPRACASHPHRDTPPPRGVSPIMGGFDVDVEQPFRFCSANSVPWHLRRMGIAGDGRGYAMAASNSRSDAPSSRHVPSTPTGRSRRTWTKRGKNAEKVEARRKP